MGIGDFVARGFIKKKKMGWKNRPKGRGGCVKEV